MPQEANNTGGTVSTVKKKYKKRNTSETKAKKSNQKQQKNLRQSLQSQQQTYNEIKPLIEEDSMEIKPFVQTITVDENGQPIYPIQMGALTIRNLGTIVSARPGYHNENWIYPVGFVSTRIYGHIKEPERKCIYTCKILDNGDSPR